MKRIHAISGAAAAAAVLSLAGATSAQAAPTRDFAALSGTINIVFDGYCDGMAITIPGSAGAPGAQAVRTGSCQNPTPLFGAAKANGVGLADATNALYTVIGANHTWAYYADCGTGQECLIISGTWSYGVAAAPNAKGLPASTAHAGALFGGGIDSFSGAGHLPGPRALSIDISFDGFCDGEHLNVPGSAGAPGVDGMETGCQTNPLIGAKTAGSVGAWDYVDGLFYLVNSDRSWILYVDCGDGTECYANSGTWSFGAPAAPARSRTLTSTGGH